MVTVASQISGLASLSQGRLAEARERFWGEADAANAAEDGPGLAEAAVGLGGLWVHEHRSMLERARVLALQRRALAGVDPSSSLGRRLHVRLLAEHAYSSGDATALLSELQEVRAHPCPLVTADALSLTHHCLLGPHHGATRLALADELIAVAATTERPLDGLMGLAWRTVDLFLRGDRRAPRSLRELRGQLSVDRCDALAYVVAALDVTTAMRAGDLVAAERLAGACRELGERVGDADATGWHAAQLVAIRWMQGRGSELLPLLEDLDHSNTVAELNDAVTAGVAALAATAGKVEIAQTALARLRSGGLDRLPSSSVWLVTMLAVCEAAHALGHVGAAAETYRLLEPFAHLPVMASLAVACYGSTHRPLGLAAMTMGDLDLAIRHLEEAAAAELALPNRPCHAISLATLADALERRDEHGDAERARNLRAEAISEATRCGMTTRATEWARHTHTESVVACSRQGRTWMVRFGPRTAAVPHAVGLRHLAELIAHPDVPISSSQLASGHDLPPSCRAEPVLDPLAKARYQQRIRELRADIDDAEECADLERASRSRVELDQFLDELARATGLHGRVRSFNDDKERARIAVRKAITRALDAIGAVDQYVAAELRARVTTGAWCIFNSRAAH